VCCEIEPMHLHTVPRAEQLTAWLLDQCIFVLQCLCIPFAPLAAAAIERSGRHLRFYSDSMAQAARHIHAMRRAQVVSRNVLRTQGDVLRSRVTGECSHCGRCCLHNSCVFLKWDEASGQSRCAIYGSRFFKLLSCGDYPMTAEDIAVYDCPSFEAQAATQTLQSSSATSCSTSAAKPPGSHRYIRIAQER
jgi:hypothetical protein